MADGGRSRGEDETVTSYFITTFGDKWKAKDLFMDLKEYGALSEVVFPSRRDKRGRRYGFTRFLNVEDEILLAIKLDNVIFEGMNLYANLPRFQRV